MELDTPEFFLDGRPNGVTQFVLTGDGFDENAPPAVTVTDLHDPPEERYVFRTNAVKVLSPQRLYVCVTQVTPDGEPAPERGETEIEVALTLEGGEPEVFGPFAAEVLFEPPVIDPWPLTGQTATGAAFDVFLPVQGLEGDITATDLAGVPNPDDYDVTAEQLDDRVKLTLTPKLRLQAAPPAAPPAGRPVSVTVNTDAGRVDVTLTPAAPPVLRVALAIFVITVTLTTDKLRVRPPLVRVVYEPEETAVG